MQRTKLTTSFMLAMLALTPGPIMSQERAVLKVVQRAARPAAPFVSRTDIQSFLSFIFPDHSSNIAAF
jgi:hypothetical protein